MGVIDMHLSCPVVSLQDESDPAMAAYRTAYRLFPGCHLPLVYLAMEQTKLNNVTMAEQHLMQAQEVCNTDPLIFNELGVLLYRAKQYVGFVQVLLFRPAEYRFLALLSAIPPRSPCTLCLFPTHSVNVCRLARPFVCLSVRSVLCAMSVSLPFCVIWCVRYEAALENFLAVMKAVQCIPPVRSRVPSLLRL